MTAIQRMRRNFIIMFALLGLLDMAAIVYLRWPGISSSSRSEQEKALDEQLHQKKMQAAPYRGIEKKLQDDRQQVKELYKNAIPHRWSEISAEIQKLAQQTGISAADIRYVEADTGLPDVKRISIETPIVGEYAKLARFINALERDKMFFLIDEVALSGQEAGTVQLKIKFDTFLKETT